MLHFKKDKQYKVSYKNKDKKRVKKIVSYEDIARDIRDFIYCYDMIEMEIKRGKYCTTITIKYEDVSSVDDVQQYNFKINIKEIKE